MIFGRKKTKEFAKLKQRLQLRLEGWQSKLLSKAGKATLIRSVAQSIPVYTMSTFRLPVEVCKAFDTLVRNFWWGVKSDGSKTLMLKAWKDLCTPKEVGGLGFRLFQDLNLAFLAKLGWAIARGDDSYWANLMRAKYFKTQSFF